LPIALPVPKHPDANAAAAVQELLGGRFGEMSTLNNYLVQSSNFRSKKKLKPFYELVASITAEEVGHVELVMNSINLCLSGSTFPADPDAAPLRNGLDKRNTYHFIATAQTSLPGDSMGKAWNGDYVFNSGNLVLDLLHNFFLECGARTHKMRVYEMTDHPVAREMTGYLLVRGGVHVLAYAKALEIMTGVD
ncbi:manganese catalase family protein, partial [Marinicrinis lubricantis]